MVLPLLDWDVMYAIVGKNWRNGLKRKRQKPPRGLRNRAGQWHYRFKVNGHEYSGCTDLAAIEQNVNDAMSFL